MTLTIYQIDAFCEKIFKGNPAAVVPLGKWIDDELMQNIAMENNLAETVFFVKENDQYAIRWFTPETEIRLCGHATLASAHYLFEHDHFEGETIHFLSHLSGPLSVTKKENGLELNFPSQKPELCDKPDFIEKALGCKVNSCSRQGMFLVAEIDAEEILKSLKPDFNLINKESPELGVIVTAKGDQVDFVSRFFHPGIGINEDPVTGSAHTVLIPYWAEKLDKKEMVAHQVSKRGGILHCALNDDRVLISGKAVTYLKGDIYV
ncbi:PhzF family phenazine biosynthesis protein [Flammeovirga sp. SJP92]|uniref:PhzF family phenazine biosynthesis protein n=1 Tax=Flammeovirga sp. SJP92 TaxID=1775430 RepID=UPI0007880CCA|nr:PhzF family phenazine biosynthesis protein [Flammeovirga sp. SJP92]KXX70077.1 hypothetical protein AVL50_14490 [Flammeovirga sp. SJP92]